MGPYSGLHVVGLLVPTPNAQEALLCGVLRPDFYSLAVLLGHLSMVWMPVLFKPWQPGFQEPCAQRGEASLREPEHSHERKAQNSGRHLFGHPESVWVPYLTFVRHKIN